MTAWLNAHGLVDGRIPAGTPCHHAAECQRRGDNCPTTERPRDVAFSCALARLASLVKLERKDDER